MDGLFTFRHVCFQNLQSPEDGGAINFREDGNLLVEECIFVEVSSKKEGGALFADTTFHVLIRNCLYERCHSCVLEANRGGNAMMLKNLSLTLESCGLFHCYYSEENPGDIPIYGEISSVRILLTNFSYNIGYNDIPSHVTGSSSTEIVCSDAYTDYSLFAHGDAFRVIDLDGNATIRRSCFIKNRGNCIFSDAGFMEVRNCHLYENQCQFRQDKMTTIIAIDCFGDLEFEGVSSAPMDTPNIRPLGFYRPTKRRFPSGARRFGAALTLCFSLQ